MLAQDRPKSHGMTTTIWLQLWRILDLANQLSQSQNSTVVKLTAILYCDWLSRLAHSREETKWLQLQIHIVVFDDNSFTAQLSESQHFFISNFILLFVQFFYEILQSIEGKKCQVPRCFVKYFFAPHSWPLLHFHIAHGGLLTQLCRYSRLHQLQDLQVYRNCKNINKVLKV